MASDDELQRQKKIFLPYLDRAEEIKAVNAKIAYYCRLYALDQTVTKIGPKNMVPVVKAVIESVAKELEKTQPNLNLNRETDKVECEQFAKMVFARADKLDRLGTGHAATRTTFYNAWLFFNVASQFDGLSLEAQKLQKYAGWRATAIQKALKAGVTPEPPPVEGAALDAQADEELMTALNSLPGELLHHMQCSMGV